MVIFFQVKILKINFPHWVNMIKSIKRMRISNVSFSFNIKSRFPNLKHK
jgi:hypothetical protein